MAISKRRLDEYRKGVSRLVEMANADVSRVYNAFLPMKEPELMRDAMLDAVQAAASKYGDMAAALASDLFEELSEAEAGRMFEAQMAESYDAAALEQSVRYASRHLFGGEWAKFADYLQGVVDKAVKQPARDTIMDSAARTRDGRTRYARVPIGPTCPFCIMLASQGFVYSSEATAGEFRDFHPHCDCQVVPSWEKSPRVEGYDPEGMYDRYLQCRSTVDHDMRIEREWNAMSKAEQARWADKHGGEHAYDNYVRRCILREMETRDRRWLFDGTAPKPTFENDNLMRETIKSRKHELLTAGRLSRLGINCNFVVDSKDDGSGGRIGLADFANGYEIKTLSNTASRNTVNGYLKNTSKKQNAIAVIFDNVDNPALTDDKLARILLESKSFKRGRVYVLTKDKEIVLIR